MANPTDTIITIKTVADPSGADKTAQASEGLLRFGARPWSDARSRSTTRSLDDFALATGKEEAV